MFILSNEEAANLSGGLFSYERKMLLSADADSNFPERRRINYSDSVSKISNVIIAMTSRGFSGGLIAINDWGIWPSSEENLLYYNLRRQSGACDLLSSRPSHFFLKHEGSEFQSLLRLSLLNGWGGLALNYGIQILQFSHDGYADIYEKD